MKSRLRAVTKEAASLIAKGIFTDIFIACFKSNHPMEFVARQEGRITDSIFLQVHPSVIHWEGVLFFPGMANTNGMTFHGIDEARGMIDYEVLYSRTNWSDPQVQQRLQAAEKYEILVPRAIPLNLIRNLPNG